MKLVYIGRMPKTGIESIDSQDLRLWNVIEPSSPYHLSTRTLEGLRELGAIK